MQCRKITYHFPMNQSLWESLGGETTMWKVVDDFVDRALKDPKVNYTRNRRYHTNDQMIARTKKGAFDFLSGAMGGPYRFRGPSLTEIHGKMEITDAEFNAFISHFKAALEKNGISPPLIQTVMGMVEQVRFMIVTAA